MRAIYRPAPDIQRGANDLVNRQRFRSNRRADNIDHRIDPTNLVKVNLLDVAIVDFRLSLAEGLKDGDGGLLGTLADGGCLNDLLDLL